MIEEYLNAKQKDIVRYVVREVKKQVKHAKIDPDFIKPIALGVLLSNDFRIEESITTTIEMVMWHG